MANDYPAVKADIQLKYDTFIALKEKASVAEKAYQAAVFQGLGVDMSGVSIDSHDKLIQLADSVNAISKP